MSEAFGHKFYVIDETQFHLGGTNGRFKHRASIGLGLREFMYFIDTWTDKTYIEEITGGRGPAFIDDESLWEALGEFITEKGFSIMGFKDK